MFDFWQEGSDVVVQIGVPCKLSDKTLQTPLKFRFSPTDAERYQRTEEKIGILQKEFAGMLPGKKDGLINDCLRTEAFRASKIQHVFKEIGEPDDETQRMIMSMSREDIFTEVEAERMDSEYLIMRNTAIARQNQLARARKNMAEGKAIITAADTLLVQGDIYWRVNEARHITNPMERKGNNGFVRTGEYKRDINGAEGFKTVHPKVTPDFMEDFEKFLESELAKGMHPMMLGSVARTMFVLIHPVDDGNGRDSTIINESIIDCHWNGKFGLRDLVTLTFDKDVPLITDGDSAITELDTMTNPLGGSVDMKQYLAASHVVFDALVNEAFQRAQIARPYVGR